MKKLTITIYLILIIGLCNIFAQNDTLYITGNSSITINQGSFISVNSIINNSSEKSRNRGDIYLTGDLINKVNKTFPVPLSFGNIHFEGTTQQHITGDSIQFTNFMLNNPAGLILDNNIKVLDSLYFMQGNLALNKNSINLNQGDFTNEANEEIHKQGKLVNENANAKVIVSDSGFIFTDILILGQATMLPNNSIGLGIQLETTTFLGNLKLVRGHIPTPNTADGSINKYINVVPYNTLNLDEIDFHYFENDYETSKYSENLFQLWSSQTPPNTQFERLENSVVNTTGDFVNSTSSGIITSNETRFTVADVNCDNPPIVNFPDTLNLCEDETIFLSAHDYVPTGQNSDCSFLWNTGSDNDTIAITESGLYWIMITDIKGCFSFDSTFVKLHQKPVTGFHVPSGGVCLGNKILFTNTCTSEDSIISYFWNFGNGTASNSSEDSVYYNYDNSGIYDVTLITTSDYGCSDTSETKQAVIHAKPVPDFAFSDGCADNEITFTNTTVLNGLISLEWNLNDTIITVDTLFNNSIKRFYNYGAYDISLIATSGAGCKDTISKPLNVFAPVTAGFTSVDSACANSDISFTDNSVSDDIIVSYYWNFNNESSATIQNPVKSYYSPGTYLVTLIVETSNNCNDTAEKYITINSSPLIDISVFNEIPCQGLNYSFFSNTSDIITEYLWDFGDGNTSNQDDLLHTFINAGTYAVTLQVTSENQCKSDTSKTVIVNPVPVTNFSATTECEGNTTVFFNQSTISQGNLSYIWNFGSENSTEQNPLFEFENDGIFDIELIASSSYGCKDTIVNEVYVNPHPEIHFGDTIETCTDNYTINIDTLGTSFFWQPINSISPSVNLTQSGNYSVKITNEYNCNYTDYFYLKLEGTVKPNLGADLTSCGYAILNANNPGSGFYWYTYSGNDSVPLINPNQYFTIEQSGTYFVKVVQNNGCEGFDTINVQINPLPQISLGNDITACDNTTLTLNAETGFETYLWNTGENTHSINVSEQDEYFVTVTNSFQCSNSDTINVLFNNLPYYPFENDIVNACNITNLNAMNLNCQYLWSTGEPDREITVSNSGNYWVTVTNGNNCSITDTVFVTISNPPVFDLGTDITGCEGTTINLTVNYDPTYTYNWTNSNTSNQISVINSGIYGLNITNSAGCYHYDEIQVSFIVSPSVNLGNDKIICKNESYILNAGNNGCNWQWNSDNGFHSNKQEISVDEQGKYWVTVSNSNNCTDTDTVNVLKSEFSITADFLVASEIFTGDQLQFVNLSSPEPDSNLWYFGDGWTDSISDPVHPYYIAKDYNINLYVEKGGCSDMLQKTITVNAKPKSKENQYDIVAPELIEFKEFIVYPNPSDGNFTVEIELSTETEIFVFIYGINGVMYHYEIIESTDFYTNQYNFTDLAKGMYLAKAIAGNNSKTFKIVIM